MKDDKERKRNLYLALIQKVMNARFTEEFRKYREKYVARKSSEYIMGLTLRTELKSTKKGKKNYNTNNKLENLVNKYESMVQTNQKSIVDELSINDMNKPQWLETKRCLDYTTPSVSPGNNPIFHNKKKKKKKKDVDPQNEYSAKKKNKN